MYTNLALISEVEYRAQAIMQLSLFTSNQICQGSLSIEDIYGLHPMYSCWVGENSFLPGIVKSLKLEDVTHVQKTVAGKFFIILGRARTPHTKDDHRTG